MSKHTPGPWFIWKELAMKNEGLEPDEIEFELLDQADHCIYAGKPIECTRGRLKGHTAHICNVDADDCDFDDNEDEIRQRALANARLIAAAPDLLETIRMLRAMCADFGAHTACEVASAAIFKATGEQT